MRPGAAKLLMMSTMCNSSVLVKGCCVTSSQEQRVCGLSKIDIAQHRIFEIKDGTLTPRHVFSKRHQLKSCQRLALACLLRSCVPLLVETHHNTYHHPLIRLHPNHCDACHRLRTRHRSPEVIAFSTDKLFRPAELTSRMCCRPRFQAGTSAILPYY